MIQVCSQCGTRWNVRDRQRSWCPRCGGTLLAPSTEQQWAADAGSRATPPRLAPGYRWIAVRPGAPPPTRRQRRPLGPTPRYRTIPSWGLQQQFEVADHETVAKRRGPGPDTVRLVLILAMIALGIAAFTHIVRYALLLINRSVLLHPVIAWTGVTIGLLASLMVLAVMFITVVLLVYWLVDRRSAAYAQRGQDDPRGAWELWICCLLPLVNLFMAPVFVLELASVENRLSQLRRPIVVWWIVWVLSAVVAVWSIVRTFVVTFFANNPQNIADNTVTVTIGYLLALAAVVLITRVFNGFERTATAHRSLHRWVVVDSGSTQPGRPAPVAEADGADQPKSEPEQQDRRESSAPVESEGQNPAA